MTDFRTLADFLAWCHVAPEGTSMSVREVGEIVGGLAGVQEIEAPHLTVENSLEWTWREKLWLVPAERRLGVTEACEALGRSRTWLYAQMAKEQPSERLPHRRLDGRVLFTAGEIRAWIRDQEETVHGGRMESTLEERGERLGIA